jgi:hypothetical protein
VKALGWGEQCLADAAPSTVVTCETRHCGERPHRIERCARFTLGERFHRLPHPREGKIGAQVAIPLRLAGTTLAGNRIRNWRCRASQASHAQLQLRYRLPDRELNEVGANPLRRWHHGLDLV